MIIQSKIFSLLTLVLVAAGVHAQQTPELAPGLPGRMVDIGGYRLHIDCIGTGSPTVILENGLGDNFADWALVQPDIGKFTTVCSYDRSYDGFSDAGPIPVTMHQQVYELHTLLKAVRLHPPYILVGHSYGGILSRLYTMMYPSEVKGMVLVDATHEDVRLGDKMYRERAQGTPVPPPHTMKTSPPSPLTAEEQKQVELRIKALQQEPKKPEGSTFYRLPPDAQRLDRWARTHPKFSSTEKDTWQIWIPEELEQIHDQRAGKKYPLGKMPLIVLGTRHANPGDFAPRLAELNDMASLSRNSRLVVDEESTHHIQWDNPALVIRSVREVCESAKKNVALTDRQEKK